LDPSEKGATCRYGTSHFLPALRAFSRSASIQRRTVSGSAPFSESAASIDTKCASPTLKE